MDATNKKLLLVVGLGNPGDKYKRTYHNIGSLFIDYLIRKMVCPAPGSRVAAKTLKMGLFTYIKVGKLYLVQPLVYMNESGEAVFSAMKYFKVKPENLLLAHDDSDIELGKYKLSLGRSSAGHKGIESVINRAATKDFWRLRIGIQPKPVLRKVKAEKLVMRRITDKDWLKIQKVFREARLKLKLNL